MPAVERPGVPFTVRLLGSEGSELQVDDRDEAIALAVAHVESTGERAEVVRIYSDEETVYDSFEAQRA